MEGGVFKKAENKDYRKEERRIGDVSHSNTAPYGQKKQNYQGAFGLFYFVIHFPQHKKAQNPAKLIAAKQGSYSGRTHTFQFQNKGNEGQQNTVGSKDGKIAKAVGGHIQSACHALL